MFQIHVSVLNILYNNANNNSLTILKYFFMWCASCFMLIKKMLFNKSSLALQNRLNCQTITKYCITWLILQNMEVEPPHGATIMTRWSKIQVQSQFLSSV